MLAVPDPGQGSVWQTIKWVVSGGPFLPFAPSVTTGGELALLLAFTLVQGHCDCHGITWSVSTETWVCSIPAPVQWAGQGKSIGLEPGTEGGIETISEALDGAL